MESNEKQKELLSNVNKLKSDVYGLKWRPSLEPYISDDEDMYAPLHRYGNTRHWSELNKQALIHAFSLVNNPKVILEIGVHRPEPTDDGESSTTTLLNLKHDSCMYIGVDVNDRSFLNNSLKNIFTLKTSSSNRNEIYKLMDWFGVETIDFAFIDGWHSVNQVLNDWMFWERMSPNAVMAFHDTNYHPGPIAIFDAIDTDIFSVELFGRGQADWGVGVVQRLRV